MKRIVFVVFILSGFFIIRADASAGFEDLDNVYTLNGTWFFKTLEKAPVGDNPGFLSSTGWDTVQVPGNWDTEDDYADYVGAAAYRRNFRLPLNWKGSTIRIQFDAVYETAKVYLNGHYVGMHRGGYTPFTFNVTDLLLDNEENEITVIVDNSYGRGAWWSWGGISRNVTLVREEAIGITGLKINTLPDLQTKIAKVLIQIHLKNENETKQEISVSTRIYPIGNENTNIADTVFRMDVLDRTTSFVKAINLQVNKPINLWSFDHPKLYGCELKVYHGDTLITRKRIQFGFRTIKVSEGKLYLNGEAVRLAGFNRVPDHRAYGSTEPFQLIKRDLDDMKRMGCNMTRMMHVPLAPELLDYADKIGLLIIQEIPVWGKEDPQAYKDSPPARQWLKEMIDRDYNHPSVVGWSVANELSLAIDDWTELRMGKEQQAYVASMINYVREQLDSTRLLTYVSLTAFRPRVTVLDDPAGLCDLICFNNYGDFVEAAKVIHERWPNKAVFVSEFGGAQMDWSADAVVSQSVLSKFQQLGQLPYVVGASLWSYNDYRSRYPGTPLGGDRTWGVVDVWRKPKKATRQIIRAFSPVHAIEADWKYTKKQVDVSITPRSKTELPAYLLEGYQLKWEFLTKSKEVLYTDSLRLRSIYPGDEIINEQIVYRNNWAKANLIRLTILNPVHCTVYEEYIYKEKPGKPHIKQTIGATDVARIIFSSANDATGYTVTSSNMDTIETTGSWIDIPRRGNQPIIQVVVRAKNPRGSSEAIKIPLRYTGEALPPVIRAIVPVYKSLIVGYSVSDSTARYELQLHEVTQKQKVYHYNATLKGSVKINGLSPGRYLIRIRSIGKEADSQWSPWETATVYDMATK